MSEQSAPLSVIAQWIKNHKTASLDSASTLLAAQGDLAPWRLQVWRDISRSA